MENPCVGVNIAMSIVKELEDVAQKLSEIAERLDDAEFISPLEKLENAADEVGKAWSGSCLGYHANVYYADFVVPPPGDSFSQEWGIEGDPFDHGQNKWKEYNFADIISAIEKIVGNPDVSFHITESEKAKETFEDAKLHVLSALSLARDKSPDDNFLIGLQKQVEKLRIFDHAEIVQAFMPRGQFISRDVEAVGRGVCTPPHISKKANVIGIKTPFVVCKTLSNMSLRIAGHLRNKEKRVAMEARIGTNIFIGHGRSIVWRDLKDFIQDRLRLPWDEFNRVPVAGLTNITRLSQMLDDSAIAFLVMTAEDEQSDGQLHARMNVIHEAGLFQGRLGFQRAIVLLEDGCEEFSNIQGLGQIRFPKGDIRAVFEEVRQVLEREGLLV
jgi:hypothetical protein